MAYSFVRAITIDHTKCGTVNTTNYPLLVQGTIATLKTVANGGDVQSANGYDIAFFSNATLTAQLDHEIERWVSTTGAIIAWVRIPTLSASVDTVIYLAYGDSGISTSQQNVAGTWESSYHAVYHFGIIGGGGTTTPDSTSNANTGTRSNNPGILAGQVGDGMQITSGTTYLDVFRAVDSASLRLTTAMTIEAWVRPTAGFATYHTAVAKGTITSRNYTLLAEQTSGKAIFSFTQGTGTYRDCLGTSALSAVVFNYIVGTYDNANMRVYRNATLETTSGSVTGAADVGTGTMNMGDMESPDQYGWRGGIDEVRISNVVRTPSYITAVYNNLTDPGTFIAVGGAGAPTTPTSTTQRFIASML